MCWRNTCPTSPFRTEHESCTDPCYFSPEAPAPSSHEEARVFWLTARAHNQKPVREFISVPTRMASLWQLSGDSFSVAADLTDVLQVHGPGVYTVALLGMVAGEPEVISTYSLFHAIPRPAGCDPQ